MFNIFLRWCLRAAAALWRCIPRRKRL